jgi:hypothetical protein
MLGVVGDVADLPADRFAAKPEPAGEDFASIKSPWS